MCIQKMPSRDTWQPHTPSTSTETLEPRSSPPTYSPAFGGCSECLDAQGGNPVAIDPTISMIQTARRWLDSWNSDCHVIRRSKPPGSHTRLTDRRARYLLESA